MYEENSFSITTPSASGWHKQKISSSKPSKSGYTFLGAMLKYNSYADNFFPVIAIDNNEIDVLYYWGVGSSLTVSLKLTYIWQKN